ncbi:unnamed protein product [Rotaria sp. Silwood1]|nr:unnamed protein product [Rotaria sp. Silwood1]
MGIGEKFINQSCAFFPRNIYTEIDKFIMINYDRFYKNFVEFWSSHNTFYPCKLAVQGGGDDSLCSAAIICDGHRKIRRRLCANPNVPLSLPEYFVHLFKPLIVGCSHTPNINETLCTQCKNNNIIVETATSSITAKRKKIMKKSQSLKNAYINDMSAVSTKIST